MLFGVCVALAVSAALFFFVFARRGGASAEAAGASPPVDPGPSRPAARRAPEPRASEKAPTKAPIVPRLSEEDEDDGEITLMAPAAKLAEEGPSISVGHAYVPLADLRDEDEESDEESQGAAIPILHDEDAAIDEPTRERALFLVSAVAQTDTGRKRRRNEDRFLALTELGLFVVADGMGGYGGGDVASELAVQTIEETFRSNAFAGPPADVPRRGAELAAAIQVANRTIYESASTDPALTGMGTTLVGARFSARTERLYVGHVGDSRCYRLRDGEFQLMTTDHTLGALGVHGPTAAQLTRALGVRPAVDVDLLIARPRPGDLYLLCSDGLSKMLTDDEVKRILGEEPDLELAARRLVDRANEDGGRDNITVVLVGVRAALPGADLAPPPAERARA